MILRPKEEGGAPHVRSIVSLALLRAGSIIILSISRFSKIRNGDLALRTHRESPLSITTTTPAPLASFLE